MKPGITLLCKRLGLAACGLLLLAAVLEVVLQLSHVLVGDIQRSAKHTPPTAPDAPVILCVGDSHTHGGSIAATSTYPARLQRQLRDSAVPVNVINLGAPGTNTSQIRRRLPDWLASYKPAIVIVLACVNNCWNIMDADWSDIQEGIPVPRTRRLAVFLQTHLRTVRLAGIVHQRIRMSAGGIQELVRDRRGRTMLHKKNIRWDDETARRRLAIAGMHRAVRDLPVIVRLIREAGARPVLMTYAARTDDNFSDQNMGLRYVAAQTKTVLVDNDRLMRPLFTRQDGTIDENEFKRLFLPDLHLAPDGYEEVSRNIVRVLEESGILRTLRPSGSKGPDTD